MNYHLGSVDKVVDGAVEYPKKRYHNEDILYIVIMATAEV